MRIIAGTAKGRVLQAPRNPAAVRPTADRVRESLFNLLGQWMDDLTVLDLFAGTGALGLEALSRGARRAVFVDRDLKTARANAVALGFGDRAAFIERPVVEALKKLDEKFDLVFSDPPYADEAAAWVWEAVRPKLNAGARVVLEHGKREAAPEEGRVDQRRFGDTVVSIYGIG